MRGIVLAGGTGSRLGEVTKVINKHILPVGGRPMIHWPIKVLRDNGIRDITIVSSPDGVGQLAKLLGGGYTYRVQDKPGGIAEALLCAQNDSSESIAVILGDNVFAPSPAFARVKDEYHAHVFLKEVPAHLISSFGVPEGFDRDNRIIGIYEKPETPTTNNYAVTGLYLFSHFALHRIPSLRRSSRGEIEITELLNTYADSGRLTHTVVEGFWADAGTFEGMAECSAGIRHNSMWTENQ